MSGAEVISVGYTGGMNPLRSVLHREVTWRGVLRVLALVAVATLGALLGLAVGAQRTEHLGPLLVEARVGFSLTGDSVIDVPPLGSIVIDSHDGPLRLSAEVVRLDPAVTESALSGGGIDTTLGEVGGQVRGILLKAYLQAMAAAVIGASLAVLVVWRRPRRAAVTAAVVAGVLVLGAAAGAATWNNRSLSEPRYTGLLVFVPQVVGNAGDIVDNFTQYGDQLGDLVTNVAKLASTLQSLPTLPQDAGSIRVLHVSDIHLNPSVWPIMRSIIEQYDVDLMVDTGDIADHGTQAENQLLTPIGSLGVPYVYIRGNHDSASTAAAIADIPDTYVLDDEIVDVAGLTIAGIGDPRFTPDRSTESDDAAVVDSGQQLASTIEASSDRVDFALVHDPAAAEPLAGVVPLVLAGHTHERDERDLGEGTKLLVQGSTGGAGLRALETEDPTPLTLTVLYFDASTHDLTARDEFTLGGLGAASAEVDRVVEEPTPAAQVERRAP